MEWVYHVNDQVGYGVSADQDFKSGDFLMEYTGVVVKESSDTTFTWSYPPGGGNLRGTKYSLDGRTCGNEGRFVNHSDEPNVETKFVFQDNSWHLIYVAKKEIKTGEQLFVNYGSGYWTTREKEDL